MPAQSGGNLVNGGRERDAEEEELQAWNGVGQIFGAKRLEPLASDRIPFSHRHPGIFSKHLRPPSSSPGEESEKVILADRMGSRRCIHSRLTAFD